MKKSIFFTLMMVAGFNMLRAQEKPVEWSGYLLDFNDPTLSNFEGKSADVTLSLKTVGDTVIFEEKFTTLVGPLGFVAVTFGEGMTSPNLLCTEFNKAYPQAVSVCYTMIVHADGGDKSFMGSKVCTYVPGANFAEEARNATDIQFALDNAEPITWENIKEDLDLNDAFIRAFLAPNTYDIKRFPASNIINFNQAPSAVNGNVIDYLNLGTGDPLLIVFARDPLSEIENFFTLCP